MKMGSILGRTPILGFVAVVLAASCLVSPAADDDASADFCIYSSQADATYAGEVRDVLTEFDESITVVVADSLEKAVAADAEVLIVAMPATRQIYSAELLAAIKGKKVIGMDFGAAQLFSQLRLLINGGACHFLTPKYHVPRLKMEGSEQSGDSSPMSTFHPYQHVLTGGNFGVYVSKKYTFSEHIDVIARCEYQPEYAPLVRQDNFVLVGYAAHPMYWNPRYRQLFSQVAQLLLSQEMVTTTPVEPPTAKPGVYEGTLAIRRAPGGKFQQELGFQFDQPTQLSAMLEHSGSEAMMLLFRGELDSRHWTRKDAKTGEVLTIHADITEEDIRGNRGRYWILDVVNFDQVNHAQCKLTIELTPLETRPADPVEEPTPEADEWEVPPPRKTLIPPLGALPLDLEFGQNVWTLNPTASYERTGSTAGAPVDLKFSRDGRFIAIGGMMEATAPQIPNGGGIELWDVETGKRTFLSQGIKTKIHPTVFPVAFSSNSERLAAADTYGRVKVWDLSIEPVSDPQVLEFKDEGQLNSGIAKSVWFTPDCQELVVGANPTRRFNLVTGESSRYVPEDSDQPDGLAVSDRYPGDWFLPATKTQVSAVRLFFGLRGVRFTEIPSENVVAVIVCQGGPSTCVAISANGKLMAVANARVKPSQAAEAWSNEYRELRRRRLPPKRIALFEINNGCPEFLAQVEVTSEMISGIGLSPDGKTLVTCGETLTFWDLTSIKNEDHAAR